VKAVVVREYGPIESAAIGDIPAPTPADTEVVVKVTLAPVNLVDTLVITGKYQFLPKLPFTPGKGPVGIVSAIGIKVRRFKVGDRVVAMAEQGGYAQFAAAAEEQCYALPDGTSFDAGASISLAFDTAWFALVDRARISPGDTVLVLGATGAVGNAAIQLAKAKGAKVLAGVSSMAKSQVARDAGADGIVDLAAENLRESLPAQVHAANGGKGADIVIDPLGGDIFDAAIRALAWRGRLVVVGFAAGAIPTLKVNRLILRNIEVSGVQVSDYRKYRPDMVRQCFDEVFALAAAGKLRTMPVTKYPLASFAQALNDITGRKLNGRAVLVP
jgi:NADPH2:quinone reductase